MRVADAVTEAASALAEAAVATPRVDAEILAAFVLGIPRGRLILAGDFPPDRLVRYRDLVARRAARVPLQHLTGSAPFRHVDIAVGPGVFVPRPETELVVEWGLRWLQAHRVPGEPGPIVVDMCSGSGAIAAAVAEEAPGCRIYAIENDRAALGWLRRNVDPYRITVIDGDATDPAVASDLDGRVDLVLTNPPYVPEIGAAGLPVEVTHHDPSVAVFGGADGLAVIRPLIVRIAGLLRPGGGFAMEHDDTQAYVVPTLVHADGRFTGIELHHDLAGRPRFTTATRAETEAKMADLPP